MTKIADIRLANNRGICEGRGRRWCEVFDFYVLPHKMKMSLTFRGCFPFNNDNFTYPSPIRQDLPSNSCPINVADNQELVGGITKPLIAALQSGKPKKNSFDFLEINQNISQRENNSEAWKKRIPENLLKWIENFQELIRCTNEPQQNAVSGDFNKLRCISFSSRNYLKYSIFPLNLPWHRISTSRCNLVLPAYFSINRC